MTEVIAQVVPGHPAGVLTGPNLAREMVAGQPAATVVAMTDEAMARSGPGAAAHRDVPGLHQSRRRRLRDGRRHQERPRHRGRHPPGPRARRLLVGRPHHPGPGRAGTARRGHGGRAHDHRRPGRRGRPGGHLHQLAEPEPDGGGAARPGPLPRRVLAEMRMVAEGVKSARPLLELAAAHGVEMPIGEQVADVLEGTTFAGRGHPRPHARARPSPSSTASQASTPEHRRRRRRSDGPRAGARLSARPWHVPTTRSPEAEEEDVLDLLVVDWLLVPGERATPRPRWPRSRAWTRAWPAASGAPSASPTSAPTSRSSPTSTSRPSCILRSMIDLGVADVDTSLQLARVIGSSMARIAEAEVSPAVRGMAIGSGPSDTVEAADRFAALADQLAPGHGPPARVRLAPPRPGGGAPGHAAAQPPATAAPFPSWPSASPTWSGSPCSASSSPRRSWPPW